MDLAERNGTTRLSMFYPMKNENFYPQGHFFLGKWVDPDPPPDAMSHGTIIKTIRPKATQRSRIDDLIDCPLGSMPETRQSLDATAPSEAAWAVKVGTAGRGLHLTPTKRKGKAADRSNFRRTQRACRSCGSKTIMVCSYCRDDPHRGKSNSAFCHPTTERDCYARHMTYFHSYAQPNISLLSTSLHL
jgi:hypothetical protein